MTIESPRRPEQISESYAASIYVDGLFYANGNVDLFRELGVGTFKPRNGSVVKSTLKVATLKLDNKTEELILKNLVPIKKREVSWSFEIKK
jgi:hypothetical protein